MFKVYGVTDNNTSSRKKPIIEAPEDTDEEVNLPEDAHEIEVNAPREQDHETDVGQIAVDVLDCPNSIVVVAPIAGVDPSDVDIGLSRNILTISGHRKEAPIYLEARRMLVEECFYGAFSRSIILPENLGFDEIKATVEHNVIMITIPKLNLISKTIKVK